MKDAFKTVLFLPEGQDRKGEGGLRTKGYFKKSYHSKPLISIVTVVFNGEKDLEKTIQSVINQTYENVEYIIIDGGSTDRSIDIIKKYEDQIDYWVSEKDTGIYNAMNKGITLLNGQWVNFMNAGDLFIDASVLHYIVKEISDEDEIIYGDVVIQYDNKNTKHIKASKLSLFYKGLPFCHQSCFISSDLMKLKKYDLTYKLCADFNFFYKAYHEGRKFRYLGRTIALYDNNGVTSDFSLVYREHKKIVLSFTEKYKFYYKYIYSKYLLKKYIKRLLPLYIIRKIQSGKSWKNVTN